MAYASASQIDDAQALIRFRVWLYSFCQQAFLAGLIARRRERMKQLHPRRL